MDSNADTCCAGTNFRMLADTGLHCDVFPFHESESPSSSNVPIGTCATLFQDTDGLEYILIGHQMLFWQMQAQRL